MLLRVLLLKLGGVQGVSFHDWNLVMSRFPAASLVVVIFLFKHLFLTNVKSLTSISLDDDEDDDDDRLVYIDAFLGVDVRIKSVEQGVDAGNELVEGNDVVSLHGELLIVIPDELVGLVVNPEAHMDESSIMMTDDSVELVDRLDLHVLGGVSVHPWAVHTDPGDVSWSVIARFTSTLTRP